MENETKKNKSASKEIYQQLIEEMTDSCVVVQAGKIVFINKIVEEITGYPEFELIDSDFLSFIVPELREKVSKIYSNCTAGKEAPEMYELEVLKKTEERLPIEIKVKRIMFSNKPATLSICRDITERKKLEEQLLYSEKMKIMGMVSGGIAHNFNNLLTVILGKTQLLIRDTADKDLTKSLKVIEKATFDVAELVKRIQEFTRVRREKDFIQIDVNKLM